MRDFLRFDDHVHKRIRSRWAFAYSTLIVASALLVQSILFGCGNSPQKETRVKPPKRKVDTIDKLSALPKEVPVPPDNLLTKDKIELGRLLFFDPILSGNSDVACATCHHPEFAYSDGKDISIGVNARGLGSKRRFNSPNTIPFVKRNSQTVINSAFNGITNSNQANPKEAPMFWDLRAVSLENQSLEPIKAREEMRGDAYPEAEALKVVVNRLQKIPAYRKLFDKAFEQPNSITVENMAKAIASYERTIVNHDSRFDQYMRGDKTALSSYELDGLNAFLKSGCAQCHNGPMFSDYKVHVIGVLDNDKHVSSDSGFNGSYAFRTASLRNLSFTFPYMHTGTLTTLEHVLEFYEDLAGGKIANPLVPESKIDPLIKNLAVDFKDIRTIVAFLNTLNDKFDKTIPEHVPSGLPSGGDIK